MDIKNGKTEILILIITDLHNPEIFGFHRIYVYTNGELKFPLSLFFLNLTMPLTVPF